MEDWLGTSLAVFLGLSVCVGAAAFLAGQAAANTWRPAWQVCGYCLLLGVAWRFLSYALFEGRFLLFTAFVIDVGVLIAVGLFAYRITYVSRMVSQYPWLYRRRGLWSYEEKNPSRASRLVR